MVCWGDNTYGQVTVPSGLFTAIAAGHGYSCGIRTGGEVVCWGDNTYGQVTVPSGLFTAIAAGGGRYLGGHSCGYAPAARWSVGVTTPTGR